MTDDRYRPPEPAPVRDPHPEITVITGLEGPVHRPVRRRVPAEEERDATHLFTARLFPGGGGRDDSLAAAGWARETLEAYGLSCAWPVAQAMITAGRTRRPWWLSLRADGAAVVVQILRARAHRLPRLPDPVPGLADGVRHTYSVARFPDGLCLWAAVTTGPEPPPTRAATMAELDQREWHDFWAQQ